MILEKSNPLLANEKVRKQMLPILIEHIKNGLARNQLRLVLVKNGNMWQQAKNDAFLVINYIGAPTDCAFWLSKHFADKR